MSARDLDVASAGEGLLVDTSAVVAILRREAGWEALARALALADRRGIAAASVVELSIVLARAGVDQERELLALLHRLGLEILPVDERAAMAAREGNLRFGRAVGARAALNFGDCLVYGVARASGLPLLFKGDDFARTDLPAVPY